MEKPANFQMFSEAEGTVILCESFEADSEMQEEIALQEDATVSETVEIEIASHKTEWIWTRKVQTEEDIRATDDLLDFLATPKIAKALRDKKSHKAKLWEEVAEHLINCGYKISDSVKGAGLKCHQKWRNLDRSYTSFMAHFSAAGKRERKPPSHLEKLHMLLEKKHRVHSPLLLDSGEVIPSEDVLHVHISEQGEAGPSGKRKRKRVETPGSSENREERSTKPKSIEEEILSTLQKFTRAEEKRFEVLRNLLKDNLEEKKSVNHAFKQYLYSITRRYKKRRRDDDSSTS